MFGESLEQVYNEILQNQPQSKEESFRIKLRLANAASEYQFNVLQGDLLAERDEELSSIMYEVAKVYVESMKLVLSTFIVSSLDDLQLILNRINDNVQNAPELDSLRDSSGFPYVLEFRRNHQEIIDFLNHY